MTPIDKNKLKNGAQCRLLAWPVTAVTDDKKLDSTHYVEGYAARFEPYVLYEDEEGPVYECFERGCFAGTDTSDVIMQYDHQGRVYARNGNGSLWLGVDDGGLRIAADLSRTEGARQLYEDIKTGMITKMSWRFTLGDCTYDKNTRTICHHTVKKIWDVSAVSIPANPNTEINARSWSDGVIAEAARREAELEERRQRLRIKLMLK